MNNNSRQTNKTKSPIIVALDYSDSDQALSLVDKLDPVTCRLKVGKQLFSIAGPVLVETLVKRGYDVFLDLKFHDIPVTVANACKAVAGLGVWMLNVHASGGRRMMDAARSAIRIEDGPLLVAVSVLTSMDGDDLHEIGVDRDVDEQVQYLSRLASDSGLDGVICSAKEAVFLKQDLGKNFFLVTPGIRTDGSSADDQRRITTPEKAIESGADYIVIGRSITRSQNPAESVDEINKNLGIYT